MFSADTHVHVYPCYDLDRFLRNARTGLLAAGHPALLCLTERHDCRFFQDLAGGTVNLPGGYRVEASGEAEAVSIVHDDGDRLFVVAGRQIVTAEKIEVLALTRDLELKDGKPVRTVLDDILHQGGIPVLSWAPGKWMFKRGRIIDKLIETCSHDYFLLGDTSLRPTVWPTPRLMKLGRKLGFRTVYGSDPLPVPGDEEQVASYRTLFHADFRPELPASSLRYALTHASVQTEPLGSRGTAATVWKRLRANEAVRRG